MDVRGIQWIGPSPLPAPADVHGHHRNSRRWTHNPPVDGWDVIGPRGPDCRSRILVELFEILAPFGIWSDLGKELAPYRHLLDLYDLSSHAEFVLS